MLQFDFIQPKQRDIFSHQTLSYAVDLSVALPSAGTLAVRGAARERERTEREERHVKRKEGEKHPEANFSLRSCDETDNSHMTVLLYLVLVLVLKLYLSTFFGYWYLYLYLHAKYWYWYWYLNL